MIITESKDLWISLQHSGMIVDLSDPKPDTILVEDIAHNLAVEARFNGATNWEETGHAYSVGQHSCLVSDNLPDQFKLCGLMHDSPEAYLRDLHTQAKRLAGDGYRRLEHIFWLAISRKFNLPVHLPAQVKLMDRRLLVTEGRDLCHPTWRGLDFPYEPLSERIVVWSAKKAKEEFLFRFYALI